jgi:hypothetical protein
MNGWRFAAVAATLSRPVVLSIWVVAWLASFGSAGIENTGAATIMDRRTPSPAADTEFTDAAAAIAMDAATVDNADAATTGAATDTVATSHQTSTRYPEPNDTKGAVSTIEVLDECLVLDTCIDRYLWALYQRTPKEDSIKESEQRKVKVKKRGRMVTVTKTFTRLVDEDFTWKDPKAAEKAGMPIVDYVIGGVDRSFKLRLFQMLHAADEAGLSPGITSAFRDDYRQSIASGLKAAANRSYHGGSLRGGYGHGLAIDVVSIKGETRDQRWVSSENLWKWIDAHGKEFGIGRPYLDRDPPHLSPIDGREYADHSRGTKVHHAGSEKKKRSRLAARSDHGVAKRPRT